MNIQTLRKLEKNPHYKLSENLSLAGDVDLSFFKGRKILFRESVTINPGGSNEEKFVEFDPFWKNNFGFRLGTEYLKETKMGVIPIRFGVGFQPVPDPEFTLAGEDNLAANMNFSLGSGIHWNQIHLDFAYTYTYFNRSSFAFERISEDEYILIDQETNNRNHSLSFSFTGVF